MLAGSALLVLLAALAARAHETELVRDGFAVDASSSIEVHGPAAGRFSTSVVGSHRATGQGVQHGSDSAAAVATVEQFHRALSNGDSLGALALMTDDVVVLESGGFENRAEFRSHHLAADIEFAQHTRSERRLRSVTVRGDAAWVSSTSSTQGDFRGRAVNSMGAELAVLVRTPSGWRIAAIHWSSRARRG